MHEIKIINYLIPFYGNKKINPYGCGIIKIDDELKKIKFEVDTYKAIKINHKKINGFIINKGSLYNPKLYFKYEAK